ncbi:MAG: hypothetical protein ABI587_12890 [Gemmatimonadales bacterium]
MVPVPFSLRVSGKDLSAADTVAWTTFRLVGLLVCEANALRIQWSGTGLLDAVTGLAVRSEIVPIPPETLLVPLAQICSVQLVGGWWRPRLEMIANDLDTFRSVPGAEGAHIRFWLARRDRPLAKRVMTEVHLAARASSLLPSSGPSTALQATTPPNGAV